MITSVKILVFLAFPSSNQCIQSAFVKKKRKRNRKTKNTGISTGISWNG